MKIEALHMSDAEHEIMEYLWSEQRPVTAADIIAGLSHRIWKPSTVHTIVMHLVGEGFIKYYKLGGKNYYVPYISDFDYSFVVTKAFIEKMHGGSIVETVRTLLCDLELSREELIGLWELVNAAVCPHRNSEAADEAEEEEEPTETNTTAGANIQPTERAVFSPVWTLWLAGIVYETCDKMDEDSIKYLSSA